MKRGLGHVDSKAAKQDAVLGEIADGLAELVLKGVPARSLWALRTALDLAVSDGVGGVLAIKLPYKSTDSIDAMLVQGNVEVRGTYAVGVAG